jgi:hypothetical protein
MVPEPGFFDGTRSKFEDWWRQMKLYMRFNKIASADDKATAVLARFRGGTAGPFAQMVLMEMEDREDTIPWEDFEAQVTKNFSDEADGAVAEWKIETFKQNKKHIADFLIEFEVLKTKSKTDEAHATFLLKKNVRSDIIKAILGYPPASIPTNYNGWKKAILSVGQGYESTEIRNDYRTGTGITFGGSGQPMEVGRQMPAFNERGQPKCFKCNTYGHMAKDCRKGNNKGERKCYNCGKGGHFAKDCRLPKKNRIRSMTGEEEEDDEETQQHFGEGSE